MIEIKDVIHLYLGADCQAQDGHIGILTTIDKKFYGDSGACQLNSDTWYSVKMVKPILRPISDMTEEEKRASDKFNVCSNFELAEWFRYLLSKHFDIFNLHEQGLCLYKSDLK